MRLLLLASIAVASGCATLHPRVSAEDLDLTRSGFISELLTPVQTDATEFFSTYTQLESYLISRADLVLGIDSVRNAGRFDIKGVLITGPSLGLWTYRVYLFLDEGEQVRVNGLVMPHGRVTAKWTGLLSQKQFAALGPELREHSEILDVPLDSALAQDEYDLLFLLTLFGSEETNGLALPRPDLGPLPTGVLDSEALDQWETRDDSIQANVDSVLATLNAHLPDSEITYDRSN